MNDRELLELSAKAYGCVGLTWRNGSQCFYYDDPETGREQWDPLQDDGQALRLAVKLRLHISQQLSYVSVSQPHGGTATRGISWSEQYNDEPYAATRRAIVRAAAEIGKTRSD